MKKHLWLPGILIVALLSVTATSSGKLEGLVAWDENTPISEILKSWGDTMPDHYYKGTPEEIKQGRDLLTTGRTIGPDGKGTWLQSKHYKCTHCHNLVREDPDLREPTSENRLAYAIENNLPYLPGTTLYGVVNRATWYNDDYVRKYGQPAQDAHDDLRSSIQLCATTCSQGRALKDWEMNAVLAYLWSIELRLRDLRIGEEIKERLLSPIAPGEPPEARISRLKRFWFQASPATFGHEPDDFEAGYDYLGDPRNGESIYELTCLHCHEPGGITYFVLDDERLTFQHLQSNMETHGVYNLYHVVRDGVPPYPGEKAYMPNFTNERMSDRQVEDLRAYIELRSTAGL